MTDKKSNRKIAKGGEKVTAVNSPDQVEQLEVAANLDPLAGEHIKAAREAMGLTQTELGARLTPPAGWRTVAHWEAGDFRPKSPRREQLASILGIQLPGFAGPHAMPTEGVPVAPQAHPVKGSEKAEIVRGLLAMRDQIDKMLQKL